MSTVDSTMSDDMTIDQYIEMEERYLSEMIASSSK